MRAPMTALDGRVPLQGKHRESAGSCHAAVRAVEDAEVRGIFCRVDARRLNT